MRSACAALDTGSATDLIDLQDTVHTTHINRDGAIVAVTDIARDAVHDRRSAAEWNQRCTDIVA